VLDYCERPFHGKVALVDEEWATVGSSNLDPLSLSLNLEANVFLRDREFVRNLRARLETLQREHCQLVDRATLPRRRLFDALLRPLVFHCARRFPRWAGWLPAHAPRIRLVRADDVAAPRP
jgi:cardiolipin synthase